MLMDSQWLKMQFDLHPDKTKAALAKALGLEPPAVSKIIKGTRQIKAQEYMIMRRFFGLPSNEDRPPRSDEPGGYKIAPLQAAGGLGEADGALEGAEWVIPAEILIARTSAAPNQIKIFQIRETIMEPDFKQGEYVLVDLSDCVPSPPGAFIVSDGFGHMARFCEFIPKSKPPEVRVSAKNNGFLPQTLTLSDFNIVGRIIAKLQML